MYLFTRQHAYLTSSEDVRVFRDQDANEPEGIALVMDLTSKHDYFEKSVVEMMDRLYGAALRFTRNEANAEDLIAATLEKAWKNFESLQDTRKFEGWIMRILSNTYITQWRHQKVHDKIFDDEQIADDLDDSDSLYAKLHQPFLLWYGTPEQTFLNGILKEDIERALDELADPYREVIVMVQLLGFNYEETADQLKIPVGTVRSRLNRARKQLQVSLWQNAMDENLN